MQTYLTFHTIRPQQEPDQGPAARSQTSPDANLGSTLARGARDLDLDLLRCFLRVVDSNSFSKAGEALGRTQSTISLRVKRLEQLVGTPLLVRHSKGVTLTRTGRLVLEHARAAVELNDRTVRTLRLTREQGQIRIGVSQLHAAHRIADLLAALSAVVSAREIEIDVDSSPRLLSKLDEGELDLALAVGLPHAHAAPIIGLNRLAWLASPAHEYDPSGSVNLLSLADGEETQAQAERALAAAGRSWTTPMRSSHLMTVETAARAGLGVTVLPLDRETEGLVRVDHVLPALPPVNVHLVMPPLLFRVPSIEILADRLLQRLRW